MMGFFGLGFSGSREPQVFLLMGFGLCSFFVFSFVVDDVCFL